MIIKIQTVPKHFGQCNYKEGVSAAHHIFPPVTSEKEKRGQKLGVKGCSH